MLELAGSPRLRRLPGLQTKVSVRSSKRYTMPASTVRRFVRSAYAPAGLEMQKSVPAQIVCAEWKEILQAYRMAAQNYGQAVTSLTWHGAERFSEAWLEAEKAHKACENHREMLLYHEHDHGCSLPRGS